MSTVPDRIQNTVTWLEFLRANPDSDFESVMELHILMSVQVEIMRRVEELGVTRVDVVLSALASSGIVREFALQSDDTAQFLDGGNGAVWSVYKETTRVPFASGWHVGKIWP